MIKTILFDLDDTIFDFKKSERQALVKTFVQMNIEPAENLLKRYSEINLEQWKKLERREITRDEVKKVRYELLFNEFNIDSSPQLATKLYEENLGESYFFVDGAIDTLNDLYTSYDLYLVSNGAKDIQDRRMAKANITHYFKDVFISEVVGYEKPAKEFFDYCFSKIQNFSKESTVIVGDSLTSDILGGVNSGVKTIWFNQDKQKNSTNIVPTYEIKSLSQVKLILK